MATVQIERISGQGQLAFGYFQAKGGNWIGVCEALGLTIESDTFAHLLEDIASALNALLLDLFREGELNTFLRDRGWRLATPMPSKPDDVRFDTPFDIARTTDRGLAAVLSQ